MEVAPKMARGEAWMRDNPKGSELDHAESVRKRCKKNSPSVLSCIGKRTREGCDPSYQWWAEMARQLFRGVRQSGRPQLSVL